MKNKLFFTICLFCNLVYAKEPNLSFYTQTGFEYDSNVLKTFDQSQSGFLTRLLLHADGNFLQGNQSKLSLQYNVGGKIFFDHTEQNMIIQSFDMPWSIQLNKKQNVLFKTSFKHQNENDDRDPDNLDVNEDFLSVREEAAWTVQPNAKNRLKLQGQFGYFHFFPRSSFSFFSERVGLEYRYQLKSRIWVSTQYGLSFQQFQNSDRSDTEHEFSIGLHSFIIPYFSLKYQFEINESSVDLYDSTNHRITLLISHLFGQRDKQEASLFSIHFLATLQVRNFPSVTAQSQEGVRFLLTGAEDQNFNHITLKLSYHPRDAWALEAKYSRFSNELSSQDIHFSRDLYYIGFRHSI
ncbi:MAG: hypothetical protein KDK51_05355 [Deltaproteobacteria bacterium]|nr:hypothetical protein [Deltaproteobacteria bacterium]